jgi:hypothetical protein
MLSLFLKKENQSTKWGRFSINYDLLEKVIMAKESIDESEFKSSKKTKLKVKTVTAF